MSILDWIARLFTVWKGIFSLFACTVFCSVLISLDPSERQTFHDVMVSTFLYPAQFALSRLDKTVFVFRENEALKRENTALRAENDFLVQAVRAVPRVLELASFGEQSGLRLKAAQITARDPGRYTTNWLIGLGLDDSVDVNMPVLTSRGVVGRTAKCYGNHSLVQGLGDPGSKVSVLCERSRVAGMLESWPGGHLIARFPMDADVKAGDTLVTSGMGGVFPKGLRVGSAGEEFADGNEGGDVLKALAVKPFQNPYLVEEVFVLIRRDSWILGEPR